MNESRKLGRTKLELRLLVTFWGGLFPLPCDAGWQGFTHVKWGNQLSSCPTGRVPERAASAPFSRRALDFTVDNRPPLLSLSRGHKVDAYCHSS